MNEGYSQTFKKRRVISLAPDTVVRINGLVEVQICPTCKGSIFLSEYITSVTTSLATNGTVGTANFTVSMPRHGHESKYMIRKGRVYGIKLMDEIEIFIKGRFKKGNDYESKYYKVFWGCVINIQESYSDGFLNLNIGCESIFKWLQIMKTNENPAAVTYSEAKEKIADFSTTKFASKSYANLNPYEIIVSLCTATYRNIVTPDALDTERLNFTPAEDTSKQTLFSPQEEELIQYWNERFESISKKLKLFGVTASEIKQTKEKVEDNPNATVNSKGSTARNVLIPFLVNYNNTNLMDFRPFLNDKEARDQLEYSASVFKSNLEIANETKLHVGFEFYLDTNGEVIFKPPFWNMDTRQNPVFVLKDSDILSYDFSEDANQVITRLDVTGDIFTDRGIPTPFKPRATFTDWNLARQFGIKEEILVVGHYAKPQMCYYHAISELDRINANRYSGSVTIVGRPELRLGYPVYIESRDLFGYVENISHNFSFGGSFTTQVELSAIRRKHKFKNRVMVPAGLLDKKASINYSGESTEFEKNYNYKTNRNVIYTEIDASSLKGKELQQNLNLAKKSGSSIAYLNTLENYIPVSDADGFELVGTYENGRNFYLTSDYKLRIRTFSKEENVSTWYPVDTNNQRQENGSGVDQLLRGNLDIAKDPSSSNPDINLTLQDSGVRDSLTEDAIGSFAQTTALLASQLSPKDDGGKGCSCSSPRSANKTTSQKNTPKKTMLDINNKK